jgi:hypothetical protein
MTTYRVIDHDCEADPYALDVKECKVDAPSSAHALAEYLNIDLLDVLRFVQPPYDPDSPAALWRIDRHPITNVMIREIGVEAL